MTPGLRERVAELMGWTDIRHQIGAPYHGLVGRSKDRRWCGEPIPDYPGDLNHAHAACRALLVTEKLWVEWSSHLTLIVGAHRMSIAEATRRLYTATPEEICTALLRTLGGEEGV